MKWMVGLLLLFCLQSVAQDAFPIKIRDFSKKYEAVIDRTKEDTLINGRYDDYSPEFTLKILDKSSQKLILKAYTMDIPTYLLDENNEVISNVKEIPYGSQSVLFYEDYNFDGIKDFALMNGYGSCYGGPSFAIYLAKEEAFEYSDAFSILSNEYCGMFHVNSETQTIHTTTKSGCCWHQFSEFKVIDNEPKPTKITERSALLHRNFVEVTEITYDGEIENRTEKLYFPLEEMTSQILLYFELEHNGKVVTLYEIDEKLHYVFLQKGDLIEFYFPKTDDLDTETTLQKKDFSYNSTDKVLTFSNNTARYQIYETDYSIGIMVETNGKTYDMKGMKSTAIGSLKKLNTKLTNVINEVF